jgi:hypothetical protein
LVHGTELEPLVVSASVFGNSAIEIGWDTVIARGAVLFHSLDTAPKILLRHSRRLVTIVVVVVVVGR